MGEMVTARTSLPRRQWKRYVGIVSIGVILLAIAALYWFIPRATQREITNALQSLRGGSDGGLLIAYVGILLLVSAQVYTLVKRSGAPRFIHKVGGVKLWLTIHILVSVAGLLLVLVHAGFPFQFRYTALTNHGLAGLATWLLIGTTVSGIFGRYLYRHLPAFKRAFAVWKPIHVIETIMFFGVALTHIATVGG